MKATRPAIRQNVSRRSVLGLLGFGAATAALTPTFLKTAQNQTQTQPSQPDSTQSLQIITKEIPRTKEKLPAIGLGTFMTFDALSNQPRDSEALLLSADQLQQVMRRFWDAGGRVVDTSLLYGMSEVNVGEFARTLGLTNDLFIASKTWATGEYLGDRSQAQRQLEQSMTRLSRDRIDVMQVHSLVNVNAILPLLKAWKAEGKIRYVGVTHHDPLYFAALERWIENGDLDFVQLRYSIRQREVEDRILPAAVARGDRRCLKPKEVWLQPHSTASFTCLAANSGFQSGRFSPKVGCTTRKPTFGGHCRPCQHHDMD